MSDTEYGHKIFNVFVQNLRDLNISYIPEKKLVFILRLCLRFIVYLSSYDRHVWLLEMFVTFARSCAVCGGHII